MEDYILCFACLHSFILITTLHFCLGGRVMEETDAIFYVHGLKDRHVSHNISSFSDCLDQGLKDLTLCKSAGTHLWRFGDLLKSSQWLCLLPEAKSESRHCCQYNKEKALMIPSDSCLVIASSCWESGSAAFSKCDCTVFWFQVPRERGSFHCQCRCNSFHTPTIHTLQVKTSVVIYSVCAGMWLS